MRAAGLEVVEKILDTQAVLIKVQQDFFLFFFKK
jgi:hypothetical protein